MGRNGVRGDQQRDGKGREEKSCCDRQRHCCSGNFDEWGRGEYAFQNVRCCSSALISFLRSFLRLLPLILVLVPRLPARTGRQCVRVHIHLWRLKVVRSSMPSRALSISPGKHWRGGVGGQPLTLSRKFKNFQGVVEKRGRKNRNFRRKMVNFPKKSF